MPTFCRHNRFIDRCPICSKAQPGRSGGGGSSRRTGPARGSSPRRSPARQATRLPRRPGGESLRVHREGRAEDDGYRSALLPGVVASTEVTRLIEEIAFSSGRLLALGTAPPGLYGEARALAEHDLEQATWTCFLISYLCPLSPVADGEDPFAGIRMVLEMGFDGGAPAGGIPLGPRTSHDPARGTTTLEAYRRWVERSGSSAVGAGAPALRAAHGGAQARAFIGEPGWSPERRFERLYERLALPGFGRAGRYDLLVTLGCLGLYELRADSLHLPSGRLSSNDLTTLAAKRLFAIGDPIHLERRAAALAEAIAIPVETLDVALANWASPQRATLGFPADTSDPLALERARDALAL